MSQPGIEPHLFIIMGGTGNLTRRKLLPALYRLSSQGVLKDRSAILGVARSKDMTNDDYRVWARKNLETAGISLEGQNYSLWCNKCLHYQSIDKGTTEDYKNLANRIDDLDRAHDLRGNRAFDLALPPAAFLGTIEGLGEVGLNQSTGWTRIVVEKPFGHDLASAQELNHLVHRYFDEEQIYRIDHYLGKETVQNILVFRFANAFFEHLWNRENIDNIQITMTEKIGIEGRANYYDQEGALRDIIQNHLTQLLTLVTMEPPIAFEADAIRDEKVKVLRQISKILPEEVIFGQYTEGVIDNKKMRGYTQEDGIDPNSKTETYVALKLEVANWRWKDVPIYLRTGKRITNRLTQIAVTFHSAPVSFFHSLDPTCQIEPNVLVITLQPDEGFHLQFHIKAIGQPVQLTTQKLYFDYSNTFGTLPDAYENLLLDVIRGDQTLFVRYDEVEEAWRVYNTLLKIKVPIHNYAAGTDGPAVAQRILARDGHKWQELNTK